MAYDCSAAEGGRGAGVGGSRQVFDKQGAQRCDGDSADCNYLGICAAQHTIECDFIDE